MYVPVPSAPNSQSSKWRWESDWGLSWEAGEPELPTAPMTSPAATVEPTWSPSEMVLRWA